MTSPLKLPRPSARVPLPGLEADNLLAFLALLGLLRALETARPDWRPRVSWNGSPFQADLHLNAAPEQSEIATAASAGIEKVIENFQFKDRKNVDFDRKGYREFAMRMRTDPATAALAAALTVECPAKRAGGLQAAPLVMMFGQGHQNFLERLVDKI